MYKRALAIREAALGANHLDVAWTLNNLALVYRDQGKDTEGEILRSVQEIRTWLPEADLSNLRLHPAAHHAIEIEQPGGRTDKRGQFVLPVNAPAPNADALFEQAQAAEDAGDIAEAERLYRVLMNCDPTDAAPPFNLGNLFGLLAARLKPKRRCVRPRALIQRSRKLGTIFPTC